MSPDFDSRNLLKEAAQRVAEELSLDLELPGIQRGINGIKMLISKVPRGGTLQDYHNDLNEITHRLRLQKPNYLQKWEILRVLESVSENLDLQRDNIEFMSSWIEAYGGNPTGEIPDYATVIEQLELGLSSFLTTSNLRDWPTSESEESQFSADIVPFDSIEAREIAEKAGKVMPQLTENQRTILTSVAVGIRLYQPERFEGFKALLQCFKSLGENIPIKLAQRFLDRLAQDLVNDGAIEVLTLEAGEPSPSTLITASALLNPSELVDLLKNRQELIKVFAELGQLADDNTPIPLMFQQPPSEVPIEEEIRLARVSAEFLRSFPDLSKGFGQDM